jgi:hypothetical protein
MLLFIGAPALGEETSARRCAICIMHDAVLAA